MTTSELQKQIDKLRSQQQQAAGELSALTRARTGCQQQIKTLEAQRSQRLMAARLHQDAQAQAQVSALKGKLESAEQDLRDCNQTVASKEQELQQLGRALTRAEWELRRASVRTLIQKRIAGNGEQRLWELAAELCQATSELTRSDEAIGLALQQFEPQELRVEASTVRGLSELRGDLVADQLGALIPVNMSAPWRGVLAQRDLRTLAPQALGRILEALDFLEAGA